MLWMVNAVGTGVVTPLGFFFSQLLYFAGQRRRGACEGGDRHQGKICISKVDVD